MPLECDGGRGGGRGAGEERLIEERAGWMQGETRDGNAGGDLLKPGTGRCCRQR